MRDFVKFVENLLQIEKLEEEITDLEKRIEIYDKVIEHNEKYLDSKECLKNCVSKRNQHNLERIKLELRKNHLEKEVLMFEYEQAIE